MSDVDDGEACACIEAGAIWKPLHFPLNFAVNLKLYY